MVEQFGGSISCESDPGVETKFTFTFALDKKQSESLTTNRMLNPTIRENLILMEIYKEWR